MGRFHIVIDLGTTRRVGSGGGRERAASPMSGSGGYDLTPDRPSELDANWSSYQLPLLPQFVRVADHLDACVRTPRIANPEYPVTGPITAGTVPLGGRYVEVGPGLVHRRLHFDVVLTLSFSDQDVVTDPPLLLRLGHASVVERARAPPCTPPVNDAPFGRRRVPVPCALVARLRIAGVLRAPGGCHDIERKQSANNEKADSGLAHRRSPRTRNERTA